MLTCGSLFAGVGGFDIAAERAGMLVVWQSEVDKYASAVLEHHWPGLNRGDIHDITDTAGVDVLCGGFPCQSYSVSGKRGGLESDHGELWWQFHRLISEGLPTWVVAENVPGLLSSNRGRDFTALSRSLVQLGYGVSFRVLDSQNWGVPQKRRRLYIVGHLGGEPRPEILSLTEGVSGHSQPLPKKERTNGRAPLVCSNGTDKVGTLTRAFGSKNYSNTQEVRSGSLLLTDNGLRRLTPLECERLQGFPDGWTDTPGNPEESRYHQMGNAVTVPVVEWIMKRIANGQD